MQAELGGLQNELQAAAEFGAVTALAHSKLVGLEHTALAKAAQCRHKAAAAAAQEADAMELAAEAQTQQRDTKVFAA